MSELDRQLVATLRMHVRVQVSQQNTNNMKEYINHSGGCPGADMTWENIGNEYGFKTIA